MFVVETFLSMLFVKCRSRGEQLIVIFGMLILIAACYGIGKFFLGMSEAGVQTMQEAAEMDLDAGDQSEIGRLTVYGYAAVGIAGLLGFIFAIVAIINAVRFITGTGLEDPDDGWS
jgi:hypothetical protein